MKNTLPLKVLAVADSNEESLMNSASGGAFAVLAREMIRSGGVVFGCVMNSDGTARHISADDFSGIRPMQGTKYVQSELGSTFRECKSFLEQGRDVLFSGTPCQINALSHYVARIDPARLKGSLVTCDLICHGVTNPLLLKLYFSWLESKLNAVSGSIRFLFRSKIKGWGLNYELSYVHKTSGQRKVVHGPSNEDVYYRAFLNGGVYLSRCYSCEFACPQRVGDFTLGDFWGVESCHPDFPYEKGASVVLLNTERAQRFFFDRCSNECEWIESTLENACAQNKNLLSPTSRTDEEKEVAEAVNQALLEGDSDRIFGDLLAEHGLKAMVKRVIPRPLLLKIIGR